MSSLVRPQAIFVRLKARQKFFLAPRVAAAFQRCLAASFCGVRSRLLGKEHRAEPFIRERFGSCKILSPTAALRKRSAW